MSVPEYAEAKESVVFCEGYHDRDFWAGWLPHLGWTDPGVDAKTGKRTSFKDPFGRPADGRGAILGKAYAWSYMAKWYPEHGRDGFYRHVWNDPAVRAQLEARLRATGAWSIAEAL